MNRNVLILNTVSRIEVSFRLRVVLVFFVLFGIIQPLWVDCAFACTSAPLGQITDANVQANLRFEKSNAANLALQVIAAYGKNTPEYLQAKQLYTTAQERYNAFVSTMLDNYKAGQKVDLTPTATAAAQAGQDFCTYVQSLHIPSQGTAELVLASLPVLIEVASKIWDIISTHSNDQKNQLANSLQPQITWPSWSQLSNN